MHAYEAPSSVKDRVVKRMGKLSTHDVIAANRCALVVIDMQNYFCAEGFAAEVPLAREIVHNINHLANVMRPAGGTVVWVQATAFGANETWGNFQKEMLSPKRQQERLAGLDEAAEGFQLFPALDVRPDDMRIKKIKYSAFIAGSSDIDERLKSQNIDTLLITGTLTNVCCESSARDAMMLGYKAVMLSDANATLTDEEHAASLNTFMMFFGEVMSTDEACSRLVPIAAAKAASR